MFDNSVNITVRKVRLFYQNGKAIAGILDLEWLHDDFVPSVEHGNHAPAVRNIALYREYVECS